VFCANGSNEVLQCLLLAFGGPGRVVATFEPTYALHAFIARLTGTPVVSGSRNERFEVELDVVRALMAEHRPVITFLCSPNNPTGKRRPDRADRARHRRGAGLVVVDEAYGQFAPASATRFRDRPGAEGLVVVRTFSKTWALAAARLGYLLADPAVVEACQAVALPYHLSAYTQAAGLAALEFGAEMEERVALVSEERGRVAAALGELAVETWAVGCQLHPVPPVDPPGSGRLAGPGRPVDPDPGRLGTPRAGRLPPGHHRHHGRERPFLCALEECLR